MKLGETWFLEGYIDFELQKYKLLAYLQEVNKHFNSTKLYPDLADLIVHYRNITDFKKNKQLLRTQFPKQLTKADLEKLELVYEEMLDDSKVMQELERITEFASQHMKTTIEDGTEIYDFVENQLEILPVGILPLYKNEGYLLLKYTGNTKVNVYNYTISSITHQNDKYRSLKINYIDHWTKNNSNTYEQIKTSIIKTVKTLPNPAVYCIESKMQVPLSETLLPIAKRVLIRYVQKEIDQ